MSLMVPVKGFPTRTNTTVGTSAVKVVSANTNGKSTTFQNQGAGTIFLGGSDVAVSGASRGYALFAGASFTDNATNTDWYAVSASGTNVLHVIAVS